MRSITIRNATAGGTGAGLWRQAGFTLMEVLLVMAMLVLIVAATGLWVQRSMFASRQRPVQETFLAAAAQARILAMQSGREVELSFDEAAQGFRLQVLDAEAASAGVAAADVPWLDEGDAGPGTMRVLNGAKPAAPAAAPYSAAEDAASVADGSVPRFYPLGQGAQLRVTFYLLYGAEVLGEPLDAIRYHPSGISTPVLVRIEEGGASGFSQTLLPDNLANGLRLDERGNVFTGGNFPGGRR